MPIPDPNDLVGRIFLIPQEDSQCLQARIVKDKDEYDGKLQRDSTRLKSIYSAKDYLIEDLFTYNKMLDHINNSKDDDLIESITSHKGPLPRSSPNYNSSQCNLRI